MATGVSAIRRTSRAGIGTRPTEAAGVPEQHDRDVDQEPVGERVGDLAEPRLHVPAPREEAVDLVGQRCRPEQDRRRPAVSVDRPEDQRGVDRDDDQPSDGERIRNLRQRPGDSRSGAHPPRICPLRRPRVWLRAPDTSKHCRPVRRAVEIGPLGAVPAPPPGAVVRDVAEAAAPRRRGSGGLAWQAGPQASHFTVQPTAGVSAVSGVSPASTASRASRR